MELKFIFLMLLIAGSKGSIDNSRMQEISRCLQLKCANFVTSTPATTSTSTSTTTTTTTSDPCIDCRNQPIMRTHTTAKQCFPDDQGVTCKCVCKTVLCGYGEIIYTATCTPNGRLEDCICISPIYG